MAVDGRVNNEKWFPASIKFFKILSRIFQGKWSHNMMQCNIPDGL